jgi:hypothetical protein
VRVRIKGELRIFIDFAMNDGSVGHQNDASMRCPATGYKIDGNISKNLMWKSSKKPTPQSRALTQYIAVMFAPLQERIT